MSDSKPSDSTLDSVAAAFSSSSDPFFDDLLTAPSAGSGAATTPAREGLPPTYRMRNAHYVDDLEARRGRAPDADRRSSDQPVSELSSSGPPPRLLVALALNELCQGLDGLTSCFSLVASKGRPLRERLGLELAQVEARRAGRVSSSLRVLLEEPGLTRRMVNLTDVLHRVVDDMQDELRLTRVKFAVDSTEPLPSIWADGTLLIVGLSALLGAFIAMLETAQPPAVLRAVVTATEGSALLEFHPEGAAPAVDVSRLMDIEWIDRPGGVRVGVALAAARRIAELHGGRLDASANQAGGFVVSLRLPVRR